MFLAQIADAYPERTLSIRCPDRRAPRPQQDAASAADTETTRREQQQRLQWKDEQQRLQRKEEEEKKWTAMRTAEYALLRWDDARWCEDLQRTATIPRSSGLRAFPRTIDPSSDEETSRNLPPRFRDLFDEVLSVRDELRPLIDDLALVPQRCQYLNRVVEEMLAKFYALTTTDSDQFEQHRLIAERLHYVAD
jgi:hypothetical protein